MNDSNAKKQPARPVDLYCVAHDGQYKSTEEYRLVRACDVAPDPSLQESTMDFTVLAFYAADLPESIQEELQRMGWRIPYQPPRLNRLNEVYLKFGVDYFDLIEKKQVLEGPYAASSAFEFRVADDKRAGRFSDRRVFDNVRIHDEFTLRVQLWELDNLRDVLERFQRLTKGTGLDAVINLNGWSPAITIATRLLENFVEENHDDMLWEEELTLTLRPADGRSSLREGIYILLEAPDTPGVERPEFFFQDGFVYTKDGDQKVWCHRNYLVFNLSAVERALFDANGKTRRVPVEAGSSPEHVEVRPFALRQI